MYTPDPLDVLRMTKRQGPRSLSPEESARIRTIVERLVEEAGTQSELARRLGVSSQAISRVMKGEQAGVTLARRIADATGTRIEHLLGGEAGGEERMEPRLSSLVGWDAAEAEARRRFRFVPDSAWDAVRNLRTAQPPRVITADWIGSIASDWARAMGSDGD